MGVMVGLTSHPHQVIESIASLRGEAFQLYKLSFKMSHP